MTIVRCTCRRTLLNSLAMASGGVSLNSCGKLNHEAARSERFCSVLLLCSGCLFHTAAAAAVRPWSVRPAVSSRSLANDRPTNRWFSACRIRIHYMPSSLMFPFYPKEGCLTRRLRLIDIKILHCGASTQL